MMKVSLPEALFPTDKNVMKLIRKMTGSNYSAFTDMVLSVVQCQSLTNDVRFLDKTLYNILFRDKMF